MNAQRVNEIEVLLEGVPLPASRELLVRYAGAEDRTAAALLLERLADREYASLDEVGDTLRGSVRRSSVPTRLPTAESGEPPGGDAYVQTAPRPGAVEDEEPPSEVLEQQSKTQKKQQAKQQT